MTDRRSFVATTVGALVAAHRPRGSPAHHRGDWDLVLRGGTVFDGSGAPGRILDLAISGDRIAAIGPHLAGKGADEIPVAGLAVAPGFVDIHSHGDGSIRMDGRMESVIRQGVTTIVAGQDGSSRDDYAELAGLGPAVNLAWMIGLGTLRGRVIGDADRPATADELRRMTGLVEAALASGACGASSGLEYTPGAFASPEELVALCRPLAARHLPYATHMRNEDDRLLESIDESLAVARGAGCPLQISHLKTQGPRNWGKLDAVFDRIETAARQGLDVAFDRYPYLAYSTGLTNLFPVWSRAGGTSAFLVQLTDDGVRERIKSETLAKVALIGGWDHVQISGVRAEADRPAEGQRLGAYAAALGMHPYDLAVFMLLRNEGNVGMLGFAMSEENLDRILTHPRGMVASDGGAFAADGPTHRGSPHPRGAGTFPRVLADQVRARKVLRLEEAIHKMSGLPASRIRLTDRGRLAVGLAADVVVFDPATIADRATFANPFQYPEGVAAVLVNGKVAIREGQRGAAARGRLLRP